MVSLAGSTRLAGLCLSSRGMSHFLGHITSVCALWCRRSLTTFRGGRTVRRRPVHAVPSATGSLNGEGFQLLNSQGGWEPVLG